MNLKEAIKAYLDGQVKQDAALAEKYAPEHIELCIDYIHDMAENDLDGQPGAIDDATVYKWSRDFWLEGHLEEALKKKEERKEREEKRQKEKLAGKAKKTSVKKKDKAAEAPPEKTEDETKSVGPVPVTEESVSQAVQVSLFGED